MFGFNFDICTRKSVLSCSWCSQSFYKAEAPCKARTVAHPREAIHISHMRQSIQSQAAGQKSFHERLAASYTRYSGWDTHETPIFLSLLHLQLRHIRTILIFYLENSFTFVNLAFWIWSDYHPSTQGLISSSCVKPDLGWVWRYQ